MVEDRRTIGMAESIEEAERLFIEDCDTWVMTGYYLYSKLWRAGVSAHIGTGGSQRTQFDQALRQRWSLVPHRRQLQAVRRRLAVPLGRRNLIGGALPL